MANDYMGNPGSVGGAANDALGQVALGVDNAIRDIDVGNIANNLKDKLTNMFSSSAWNPDNNDIYARRADIKSDFQKQYNGNSIRGEKMDPMVVEEMEQLSIVYPDELDVRYSDALEKVQTDPGKFGLEAGDTPMFSDNEGAQFSALEQ